MYVCAWLSPNMEAKASVPLDGTVARMCSNPKLVEKNPDCFEVCYWRSALSSASF